MRIRPIPLAVAAFTATAILMGSTPAMAEAALQPSFVAEASDHKALSEAIDYAKTTTAQVSDPDDVADQSLWYLYSVQLQRAERRLSLMENDVPGSPARPLASQVSAAQLRQGADGLVTSHGEKLAQEKVSQDQTSRAATGTTSSSNDTQGEAVASQTANASPDQSATSSQGGDDGSWNVDYRDDYGAPTGAADGACTQWADGYYVAHDWSEAGEKIASRPGTVVVDGQRYAYVSSEVVPRDTTYEEVYAFTHANGGIGFQTCYGDGYLVTHYEPY